ncbi:MAG: hypothetical protein ACLTER_27150 [Ruminococcus sp.]
MQEKEAIQAIGDIPYINKKWLDYLGLEIPTTTDELEQVLIQFRDHAEELEKEFSIEGDVIPMSFIINNGDPGSGDFNKWIWRGLRRHRRSFRGNR